MTISLNSKVPGFEGECAPTWVNTNQIDRRFGAGVTGFFRLVRTGWLGIRFKIGPEFHGVIQGRDVYSTAIQ